MTAVSWNVCAAVLWSKCYNLRPDAGVKGPFAVDSGTLTAVGALELHLVKFQ
jgi:hypothetical protein